MAPRLQFSLAARYEADEKEKRLGRRAIRRGERKENVLETAPARDHGIASVRPPGARCWGCRPATANAHDVQGGRGGVRQVGGEDP
jgi:hypothetical protein